MGAAKTKLSAVLCVRNEERRLAQTLESLAFADEVVVVLDRCTDRSRVIAEAYGAVTVPGVFPLEGPRRSAGQQAATGDWIFEIDADEVVSAELAAEVRAQIAVEGCDWRKVPIANFIAQRHVRYGWGGSFGTTLAARLYRRGAKRWGGERVHPGVRFDGIEGAPLQTALRHEFGQDVSDILRRFDRYTDLRAHDLREHGGKLGQLDNAFRGVRRFWKCYVSRQGWREGGWGLLIALMAGLYPLVSCLRARLEAPPSAEPAQVIVRAA
jgi:glycosyltransferase involved in cell wall biosynthesis